MILSRVIIDPYFGAGFAVVSDLYQSHRFVFMACANNGKDRPLYRVEPAGRPVMLVQSQVKPDWAKALQAFEIRASFDSKIFNLDSIKKGQRIAYRLLANPVKTIKDEHGRIDSCSRPKRIRVPLVSEQMQRLWLNRKAEELGVRWQSIIIVGRRLGIGYKPKVSSEESHRIRIDGVVFEGVVVISDPRQFQHGVVHGVGPAKGFGFGLLSVAPLK